MAVALKVRSFKAPVELAAFCANAANNVTTIVEIYQDSSDAWWLFYTS